MRAAYIDLDGTLLGAGGSLLHDGEGVPSQKAVRAVEACLRAGVEVVLTSGRRRAGVHELARALGSPTYIYESGAVMVLDGEELWLTDGLEPTPQRSVHQQITDSGAPALLLKRYPQALEYHAPWHTSREVSHLFRGLIDVAEAERLLAEHGHADLRIVDNGVLHSRSQRLIALPQIRAYHLLPAAASKPGAVAVHMRARGIAKQDTIAVGDSREDLTLARVVGAFWLVSNGLVRDPGLAPLLAGHPNARVCDEAHGAGVYEAVVTTLAELGSRA